jgi:hypothetical protein
VNVARFLEQMASPSKQGVKSIHDMYTLQPDKSAMAKHSIKEGHHINFKNTKVLVTMASHMDCVISEATEMLRHPNNFNTDKGFTLSQSRKPASNIL